MSRRTSIMSENLKEEMKYQGITTKELAARVNLRTTPVFERVKRMEREGIIKKYMAVVDASKIGNSFMVLCNVRLKQHTRECSQEFVEAMAHYNEVTECFNVSGDYDYQIKVYVHNMNEYQSFVLNKLGLLTCIGSLHSTFVMGVVKQTNKVPVEK